MPRRKLTNCGIPPIWQKHLSISMGAERLDAIGGTQEGAAAITEGFTLLGVTDSDRAVRLPLVVDYPNDFLVLQIDYIFHDPEADPLVLLVYPASGEFILQPTGGVDAAYQITGALRNTVMLFPVEDTDGNYWIPVPIGDIVYTP
jgi:hypothetical protein